MLSNYFSFDLVKNKVLTIRYTEVVFLEKMLS